jgi:hypothetical protein
MLRYMKCRATVRPVGITMTTSMMTMVLGILQDQRMTVSSRRLRLGCLFGQPRWFQQTFLPDVSGRLLWLSLAS